MNRQGSKPPLPNLVIAGAPRCGTTSLFSWFCAHPEVGRSVVKETFYLMDPEATVKDRGRIERSGLDGYREFFCDVPPEMPVILEATAGYLYQRTALETFANQLTDVKLVFVLRRPADRLLSTYHYFSNNWTDLDSTRIGFADFTELTKRRDASLANNDFLRNAFDHGVYVKHLRPWQARCGPERLRIVILEELRTDPTRVMQELARWVGIDDQIYSHYRFPRENENYRVHSRGMQRVNQWIRENIPDGMVRDGLRMLYRTVNTARNVGRTPEELAVLERLDQAYAGHNHALAAEFDLDLSTWAAPRRVG